MLCQCDCGFKNCEDVKQNLETIRAFHMTLCPSFVWQMPEVGGRKLVFCMMSFEQSPELSKKLRFGLVCF